MKSTEKQLRKHFLGWQCRIRQLAMREDGGRPSAGMCPRIANRHGQDILPAATLLLIRKDHAESTAFFRFQIRQTQDPRQALERGLNFLQAAHYQKPKRFSDCMLGVFAPDSAAARLCLQEQPCQLHFSQYAQSYRLACQVAELAAEDDRRQAALWHNRLWNPTLGDAALVLGFTPDWSRAEAQPPPAA